MCHGLAFETIDGTVRTLRHGEPRQVVADIRSFYRAGLRMRPAELGTERSRPGDANQVRAAVQTARAGAATGTRADQAVRAVFSQGGACFDCHQVVAPAGNSLDFGIRPVAFPTRYMQHGWFDHRAAPDGAAAGPAAVADRLGRLPELPQCQCVVRLRAT